MELIKAFSLGTLAQSSLLLAGLFACWVKVPTRLVGILAGFGAGAMISAIAFDLVPEAQVHIELWQTVLWMLIGVAIFMLGDRLVDKRFGSGGAGGAMGIIVGSVVDGVPESIIFGIQIGTGETISASFLAAVLVSNIPQAIAPSADLAERGWSAARLGKLWLLVVLACGAAAAIGYLATVELSQAPWRSGGIARRGRAARHADELADAVRVRPREGVGRSRHRRRLLPHIARHLRYWSDGDICPICASSNAHRTAIEGRPRSAVRPRSHRS
jgi:ZIP family zinc transporter